MIGCGVKRLDEKVANCQKDQLNKTYLKAAFAAFVARGIATVGSNIEHTIMTSIVKI